MVNKWQILILSFRKWKKEVSNFEKSIIFFFTSWPYFKRRLFSLLLGIAQPDENLSQVQKSINHMATVMIENHTAIAGFHWRYGYNMAEFFGKLCVPFFYITPSISRRLTFFRFFQPYITILKSKMHGIGRHSLPEIAQFSFRDLDALSALLGDKPFFNGDVPTTIDCTLFGHLVQFVYMPLGIPQKQHIQEKCPNLSSFVDRMRDQLWPDWDEMCQKACMEGKIAA